MNILTAPLTLLVSRPISPIMTTLVAPPGGPGGAPMVQSYLRVATLLTLIMLGAGIYLLVAGTPGDLEIAGKALTIKTKTAGIALIALGLLFYLAIGKLIMDRAKD